MKDATKFSLLCLVLASGCSGSGSQHAVVSGKVTLSGAPVAAGTVLLMTDDGKAASAELKADGTYLLQAQPGRFKVAVTPPPPPDPLAASGSTPAAAASANAAPIPKRYHDFGSSGLTVEVKKGNNTFDIPLMR